MYIPTTFFGSQGSCFEITTSNISGSGLITTGSFISGGVYWDYYKFETADFTDPAYQSFTASLNILSGSTGQAKMLIVGAGGAGGTGNNVIGRPAADFAAGGGGGGGVVYYNQFPLSSGSYEIAVGGATTQINAEATGSNGRNSYIKLPNNIIYTPFDSSFLIAYGGGGGGQGKLDGTMPFTCESTNGSAGPTTGGIGIYTSQCGSRNATNTIYTTLNGLTLGPQGFRGGNITVGSGGTMAATGGGGAATTGSNLSANDLDFGLYASNGGSGLQFNLTGTATYFSPGGGGQAGGDTGATGTGGDTYGRGGQGERDGNTGQINFGFGGVVIIAIPRCSNAFDCKTFAISGSGNTVSYLECSNFGFTTSSTNIPYYDTLNVCLTTLSGSNTPLILNGSYLSSTLLGSCDTPSDVIIPTTYPRPFDTCSCLSYTIRPRVNTITINRIQYCGSSTSGSSLVLPSGSITTVCLVSSSVSLLSITGSAYNFDFNGNCATSSCSPLNTLSVKYLVVAGGGAGGGGNAGSIGGAGGGGGGVIEGVQNLNFSQSYNIVVGNGGTQAGAKGNNGENSSAFGNIAIGGGAGGAASSNTLSVATGNNGGSGGGGAYVTSGNVNGPGGAAVQGQAGGLGNAVNRDSAGGGGAAEAGNPGSGNSNGGTGYLWVDENRYSGGGGGWRLVSSLESSNGLPGSGGGAGGQQSSATIYFRNPQSGTPNTGGGGGGANGEFSSGSWNGGSGVVKLRYVATASLATGGDISITGPFVYHTFTGSGTFTIL